MLLPEIDYAQAGTLMAVPFDAERLAVSGSPVPVLESVYESPTTGVAQYSFSSTGSLIYVAGGLRGTQRRLVWVDRKGAEQPLPAPSRGYRIRVSPDGGRIASEPPNLKSGFTTSLGDADAVHRRRGRRYSNLDTRWQARNVSINGGWRRQHVLAASGRKWQRRTPDHQRESEHSWVLGSRMGRRWLSQNSILDGPDLSLPCMLAVTAVNSPFFV